MRRLNQALGDNFDIRFKNTVLTPMLFPRIKVNGIAKTVAPNVGTLVEIFFYLFSAVRCSHTRVILQNVKCFLGIVRAVMLYQNSLKEKLAQLRRSLNMY